MKKMNRLWYLVIGIPLALVAYSNIIDVPNLVETWEILLNIIVTITSGAIALECFRHWWKDE